MITTETVFVLGAGASFPFGFPTGAELRARLCGELSKDFPLFTLLRKCGQSEEQILTFREQFELSGIYSIDAFIAFRPEYQEIAELAIAAALIPLETPEKLRNVGARYGGGGLVPIALERNANWRRDSG